MSVSINLNANWREAARDELQGKFVEMINEVAELARQEQAVAAAKAAAVQRGRDLLNAARALGISLDAEGDPTTDEPDDEKDAGGVTARDVIMDELTAQPGMKAAELKLAIEKRLGRKIHYKTPGMTLYRLANDGLVRREGHRWFVLKGDQRRELSQTEKELLL